MESENQKIEVFRFSDNFKDITCLQQLPKGLLQDEVDLRYSTVQVNKQANGYSIYVGPKEPERGGSVLVVMLDEALSLVDYEIEHLAAIPGP